MGRLAVFSPYNADQVLVYTEFLAEELKERDGSYFEDFTQDGLQKDALKVLNAVKEKGVSYQFFAADDLYDLMVNDQAFFNDFTADGLQADRKEVLKALDRDARYFLFSKDRDVSLLNSITRVLHGRTAAGVLRFCVEDFLQGSCQIIYLIKKWRELSAISRAYTSFTVLLGMAMSFGKPLVEGPEIYRAYKNVQKVVELNKKQSSSQGTSTHPVETPHGSEVQPLLPDTQPAIEQPLLSQESEIVDLSGRTFSVAIRLSTVYLWAAIILFPVARMDDFQCDMGTPPLVPSLVALFAFTAHLVAQVEENGGRSWLEKQWQPAKASSGRCKPFSECINFVARPIIMDTIFMFLGVLDIFNDMVFALNLWHCEPITWVSWRTQHFEMQHLSVEIPKYKLFLPVDLTLQHIVVGVLVVGVVICQCVPGIILLFTPNTPFRSAMAMKLNELGFLLAATTTSEP